MPGRPRQARYGRGKCNYHMQSIARLNLYLILHPKIPLSGVCATLPKKVVNAVFFRAAVFARVVVFFQLFLASLSVEPPTADQLVLEYTSHHASMLPSRTARHTPHPCAASEAVAPAPVPVPPPVVGSCGGAQPSRMSARAFEPSAAFGWVQYACGRLEFESQFRCILSRARCE